MDTLPPCEARRRIHVVYMIPTKNLRTVAVFAVVAGLVATAQFVGGQVRADDRQAPECLQVEKSVIYRAYGYDHFVHLNNTCQAALSCELSTATLPAQHVHLESGAQKEIMLRRGSPARTFDYTLRCSAE